MRPVEEPEYHQRSGFAIQEGRCGPASLHLQMCAIRSQRAVSNDVRRQDGRRTCRPIEQPLRGDGTVYGSEQSSLAPKERRAQHNGLLEMYATIGGLSGRSATCRLEA